MYYSARQFNRLLEFLLDSNDWTIVNTDSRNIGHSHCHTIARFNYRDLADFRSHGKSIFQDMETFWNLNPVLKNNEKALELALGTNE